MLKTVITWDDMKNYYEANKNAFGESVGEDFGKIINDILNKMKDFLLKITPQIIQNYLLESRNEQTI